MNAKIYEQIVPYSEFTRFKQKIIVLVCSGYSPREVGAQMCLSERSIEGHLAGIYQRLGVENSLGLSMWAYQSGLIPPALDMVRTRVEIGQ